jgi:hypothetical protein
MKTIISARLTAQEGEPLGQFFRGASNTVRNKIISLIEKNPGAEFDFLVDEDGSKSIMYASDLVGEVINIVDDTCIAEFTEGEDDTIEISFSLFEGALPREETVKQLKKLRKKTKGIDIGDKISDMNKQGANISYIRNPVDTGVESMEDYWKSNKKFKPSRNLNIKKFKDFK